MRASSRALLMAGGCLNLGVALVHAAIVFYGPPAYRFFGAGEEMATWAEQGSPLPAAITLGLAVVFAFFGVYAFAAAGAMRPLPLLDPAILTIGGIYTVRGCLGIPAAVFAPDKYTPVYAGVAFSLIALAIGLLYLSGWLLQRREAPALDAIGTASPDENG